MSEIIQIFRKFNLSLAVKFAIRELRGGIRGFKVFITCIVLGVATISGVTSLSKLLTEGIANESHSILGGDFSIEQFHQEITTEQKELIESLGKMSKIGTLRTMVHLPEKTNKFGETLVELKSVDDMYPLYGKFSLEGDDDLASAIQKKQGFWGIVVDPNLSSQIGVRIGDVISIGNISARINGIIEHEPDLLSQNLVIGPRIILDEQALKESELANLGSSVQWSYRVRINENRTATSPEIIDSFRKIEERFPNAGWKISSHKFVAPDLVSNIQGFTNFLTLIGITGLVVGGVGIANAVHSLIETKHKVIAILRSVGASYGFVFFVYLFQILFLTAIGISLGILIGVTLPIISMVFLSSMLPIPVEFSIFPYQLSLAVIYGFLTVLVFTFCPLGRIHGISVTSLFRDSTRFNRPRLKNRYIILTTLTILSLCLITISNSTNTNLVILYIGSFVIIYVVLIGISKIIKFLANRFPTPKSTSIRLAIANVYRPGSLTSSVVLSLGLGLTLLVTISQIDENIRYHLNESLAKNAPSLFFMDIQNDKLQIFRKYIEFTAPGTKIETTPMLRGRIVEVKDEPAFKVEATSEGIRALQRDRGFTYTSNLPLNSTLVEGDWWMPNHEGEFLVSMDREVAKGIGVKVGDTITVQLLNKKFKSTIANLRESEWQPAIINFDLIFSPNTFENLTHSHLATVTWQNENSFEQEQALYNTVALKFPTITIINIKNAIDQVNEILSKIAWAIRGISSIILITSILVLGGALAAGYQNRTYNSVVLKTLGATRLKLIVSYIFEFVVLGAVTAIFAIIVGTIMARFIIVNIMSGEFSFHISTAVLAVTIALILTVGLGLIGTWGILGEKTAPVLRNL